MGDVDPAVWNRDWLKQTLAAQLPSLYTDRCNTLYIPIAREVAENHLNHNAWDEKNNTKERTTIQQ